MPGKPLYRNTNRMVLNELWIGHVEVMLARDPGVQGTVAEPQLAFTWFLNVGADGGVKQSIP